MAIRIEYCRRWNYEPHALRARERLVATGRVSEDEVDLVPGSVGAFEVFVDDMLVFSKLASRRFPDDAEIDALIDTWIRHELHQVYPG